MSFAYTHALDVQRAAYAVYTSARAIINENGDKDDDPFYTEESVEAVSIDAVTRKKIINYGIKLFKNRAK